MLLSVYINERDDCQVRFVYCCHTMHVIDLVIKVQSSHDKVYLTKSSFGVNMCLPILENI